MAADDYDPRLDPNRDPNRPPQPGEPYGQQPYYGDPAQQGGQYSQDRYQGGGQGPQGPYGRGPYGQGPRRPEKQDEKQSEKEQEKQQEKGAGMDEKYRRNPLGFVSWALIIIWLGVTLLLQNIDAFALTDDENWWGIFAWGVGVIIIAEALLRLTMPRWRHGITGSLVWGAIAIGVGFGLWFGNWQIIGPIVVIAVGVGILLSRVLPRR